MIDLYEGLAGYCLKYWGGVCGIRRGKTRNKKNWQHNWRVTLICAKPGEIFLSLRLIYQLEYGRITGEDTLGPYNGIEI